MLVRRRQRRGEDNRNVARMAVLLAGLPTSRARHDGQPAVRLRRWTRRCRPAARSRPATPTLVLVGGVESMSRAPWVLLKPEQGVPGAAHETLHSTTLGWRMVNPEMPGAVDDLARRAHREAGRTATASRREAQDAFALRSHQRADAGLGRRLLRRLGRPGAAASSSRATRASAPDTLAREARQAQAGVRQDGGRSPPATPRRSTTAPPRCCSVDEAAAATGREPLARIAGARPSRASTRTSSASARSRRPTRALARAGHRLGRRRRWSSSTRRSRRSRSPAWREWPSWTRSSVNVNGGAIAIGHPLGASGGRILGTLAHELQAPRRRVGRRGDLHRRRPGPRGGAGGDVTTFRRRRRRTRRWTTPATGRRALRHPTRAAGRAAAAR